MPSVSIEEGENYVRNITVNPNDEYSIKTVDPNDPSVKKNVTRTSPG